MEETKPWGEKVLVRERDELLSMEREPIVFLKKLVKYVGGKNHYLNKALGTQRARRKKAKKL